MADHVRVWLGDGSGGFSLSATLFAGSSVVDLATSTPRAPRRSPCPNTPPATWPFSRSRWVRSSR
jgi:hypothetical protein